MTSKVIDKPNGFALVDESMPVYEYYARGYVHVMKDSETGEVEIRANIGTAPNEWTTITYPYFDYRHGYLTKSAAQKLVNAAKRELATWAKKNKIKLTEPTQVFGLWN